MNASPSPALIACAAMRIVCSDDEQYRVIVVPGTSSRPARTLTTRPKLKPCSPPGRPHPRIRSSISSRSSSGTLSSTACTMVAAKSSGRRSTSDPLNARPIGLRAVATITGSGIRGLRTARGTLDVTRPRNRVRGGGGFADRPRRSWSLRRRPKGRVMQEGSRKAIAAAFLANLGIAIAKFAGFAVTGAASLLAEALHSVADTGNQALLFLGGRRARRRPTPEHPFGYGRERYFWAFVVALMLFSLGALFAIVEGIDKLINPHELESIAVALAVLGVAIVLEALSFRTAMVQATAVKGDESW